MAAGPTPWRSMRKKPRVFGFGGAGLAAVAEPVLVKFSGPPSGFPCQDEKDG